MDMDKMESVLDEIVWNLMQTLKGHNIEHHDARMIIERIGHFALSGEFESFYDEFSYGGQYDPGFKEFIRDAINLD